MTKYEAPTRKVLSPEDLGKWQKSEAYEEFTGFVMALSEAVKGKTITCECKESETVKRMVEMLGVLDKWIDDIPPIDQPQRFGNKAFRTWFQKLKENAQNMVEDILPEGKKDAAVEICHYLIEGVGNVTRIDYGTGHEMAFAMFLCCLFKIGALIQEDKTATVVRIFHRYLKLVRKLLMTYRLEPAGTHGVWSLDDYHFLPFIWGSSQLAGNPVIEPKDFPTEEVAKKLQHDYMFLDCITFIHSVKTGPFFEHSNQLWNISAVQSWSKVNQGLMKMYKQEVLAKFPVIQHVVFGSILRIDEFHIPHEVFARPRPLCSSGGQGSVPIAVVKPMPINPPKPPTTTKS